MSDPILTLMEDSRIPIAAQDITLPDIGRDDLREYCAERAHTAEGVILRFVTWKGVSTDFEIATRQEARFAFQVFAKELVLATKRRVFYGDLTQVMETIDNDIRDGEDSWLPDYLDVCITNFFVPGVDCPLERKEIYRLVGMIDERQDRGLYTHMFMESSAPNLHTEAEGWYPKTWLRDLLEDQHILTLRTARGG